MLHPTAACSHSWLLLLSASFYLSAYSCQAPMQSSLQSWRGQDAAVMLEEDFQRGGMDFQLNQSLRKDSDNP
jgi:hypothetical protein